MHSSYSMARTFARLPDIDRQKMRNPLRRKATYGKTGRKIAMLDSFFEVGKEDLECPYQEEKTEVEDE